jgi:hypothetical protein
VIGTRIGTGTPAALTAASGGFTIERGFPFSFFGSTR